MTLSDTSLLLVGCGKMGSALLKGWLVKGLNPKNVYVLEPYPSEWLQRLTDQGLRLNVLPKTLPDVLVLATKPQIMADAIASIEPFGNQSALVVSIAAGSPIALFEEKFGPDVAVVRAMPNTPASIGAGITALVANANVSAAQMQLAKGLMSSVGATLVLENEEQMHAVTGLSGSGPAYVFALAEAMTEAGIALQACRPRLRRSWRAQQCRARGGCWTKTPTAPQPFGTGDIPKWHHRCRAGRAAGRGALADLV